MKSLNLQFGDNRQNQREDLFLANIAEKIQSGKINLISFVDQAQFIDLMQQKQKKKVKIQPAFTKILNIVKENLAKHQQSQQKINEVSYEIKTISSTRQLGYRTSFNVGNKSGGLLQHKDSNIKEHFTNDFSEKELQVQQILDEQIKTDRSNGNQKLQQLIVNKNEIPKFNPQTLKTTNDNSQDLLFKQDNISTGRNDKQQNFNLLTQEQSENSQAQLKLEQSQKTCYLSLGKQLLNTNNSQEASNLNFINSSATFQQLKQQDLIEPKTTTSRKQSDVIIKSIKGTIHQKNYLLNENDLQQRKNLTPVSQTTNQINSTSDKVNNSKHDNQQQQNNFRSKNSSRASNQNQQSIQKNNSKQQKSKHNKIKSQQEQKSQQLVLLQPKQSLAQIKIITDEEEHLQKIQNQETSFCGQIQNSQKLLNIENDYKQQESPQFQKNDETDDAIIGQSTQFLYKKSNRQTISYKPEQNPLNVSQHSFQSKRNTIDQYDLNSLMPPCSSRTLTSAKKERTEQRNSTSNNSENDQKQKNQLGVPFKRGSKRMKSHNVQGNEDLQQEQKKKRRYSQERLFKSENRFERLEDERFQTVNNLEQSQSSSDQNNQENDNNTPINIQISKCDKNDGRENIIEEESDGSFKQHQGILFATQDRMLLKIGDHSFYPQSSSRSVIKSNVPNTPAGSINTVHHSSSGTGNGLGVVQGNQNQKKRKQQQQQQQSQNKKNNNLLLSTEFSQTKIQFQKQKSEDSYYEKEYTNESSQEPEKPSRLKPKKLQQKLSPPTLQIQTQRRKSSAQVSPMDPRKLEQLEREKQKQLEYQKQIERMKFERELMEQYKIPEEMPLIEKKQKIESLIGELSHQHDQDVRYQVQLYNERQDQIQNIQKNYEEKIDFRYNIVNSCYYEMDYLCDHKLKLKQKDQEGQKIFHLKFQDQNINLNAKNFRDGDKQEDEEASPYKKQQKIVSSYDPVEIENQIRRKLEFETETEMLQFLRIFQQEFGKQVLQCTLDFPMKDTQSDDRQVTRGFIPRNFKRKQTKQVTHKIEIGNYQLDQNKTNYLKQKANQIQKMGQFLLMDS